MKIIYCIFLALSVVSCKSYLFNKALEFNGVYDDTVSIEEMHDGEQSIVFIPMHHIGTSLFYQDVQHTIDSLKSEGYYFYTEGILDQKTTDTSMRKFRKFLGSPLAKNGYMNVVDSVLTKVYNVKLKKELMDQPSYDDFQLSKYDSRKVDSSIDRMLALYEAEYGEIILEECDFETPVYTETTCKDEKTPKKILNTIIVDSRNQVLVKAIEEDRERLKKIAIIYGKNHFYGVQEILLEKGYKISNQ